MKIIGNLESGVCKPDDRYSWIYVDYLLNSLGKFKLDLAIIK